MRSLIKTVSAALAAIFTCFCFTACLNPVSIDSSGFVVAVGVDLGKTKPYEVTLQLQRESAGDASSGNGGSIILSVEASDLFNAAEELSYGIPYTLNFSRTHVFIFGKELAEKGLIGSFLDFPFDLLRIRLSALMIVVDSPVRDYIGGLASNNTPNVAKLHDDIVSDVGRTGATAAINAALYFEAIGCGLFDPVMTLGSYDEDVITDTGQKEASSKGENPIGEGGEGRIGGMKSFTSGSALFDGGRMCGELDQDETRYMNMGSGDFRQGTIQYETDKGTASLFVKLIRSERTVELTGESAKAVLDVKLTVSVENDPSGRIGREWLNGERETLACFIRDKIVSVFIKCRCAGCDAFRLGRSCAKYLKTVEEYRGFDWKSIYNKLEFEVKIDLTLDDEYTVGTNGGN